MTHDVIIIGGGASGLAAACRLAGRRVLALEKQPRVGRKLLATGNGRCNFTNIHAAKEDYPGERAAAERVLFRNPPDRVIEFFEHLGVPAVQDDAGRVYPMSGQAASVLDALRLYAVEHGVEILTNSPVTKVEKGFSVRAGEKIYRSKCVLIATGGLAAPKLGACGDGYRILQSLGHPSARTFPALTPLKTSADDVRSLKGQRIRCDLILMHGQDVIRVESGELLFSEDGLSGIAAMQLSRDVGALGSGCEVRVRILKDKDAALSMLKARRDNLSGRMMEDFLSGIVPKRVGMAIVKRAGILPMSRTAHTINDTELSRLAHLMTDWRFPISGTNGFDAAQVTAGGVRLKDFDWDTLESKKVPGLYAAGEMLDVDGDCGGYNLQWAWASALTAAQAIEQMLSGR